MALSIDESDSRPEVAAYAKELVPCYVKKRGKIVETVETRWDRVCAYNAHRSPSECWQILASYYDIDQQRKAAIT